jgi:uncharacterized protein with von Willebrand factor type A (vWA) domain
MGRELQWPSERVLAFSAFLRASGFQIGPQESADFLRVLELKALFTLSEVERLWRPIACQNKGDVRAWNDLFFRFWAPHRVKGSSKVTGQLKPSRNLQQRVEQSQMHSDPNAVPPSSSASALASTPGSNLNTPLNDAESARRSMGGASQVDALHDRRGQQWMPTELASLEQLARRIQRTFPTAPTRRWKLSLRGSRLDGRRTLRKSAALLGESLVPCWRARRREPVELVILADASRSMEAHAALALRTARVFQRIMGARIFVFHVRLMEVTDLMRLDTPAVQERINAVTAGFQSGTRIAECVHRLQSFKPTLSLGRRTRLWIFSDGFDTDGPDELARVLAGFTSKGVKVDWFYPTREKPASLACVNAHPYVENWLAAENLTSLRTSFQHASF